MLRKCIGLLPPRFRPLSLKSYQQELARVNRSLFIMEKAQIALARGPLEGANAESAFNAQSFRRKMFDTIVEAQSFDFIAETGTFLGDTTAYLHAKGNVSVHTSEIHPVLAASAAFRLSRMPGIVVRNEDSRAMLRYLRSVFPEDRKGFLYLDAHWLDDLPLGEEIDLVGSYWREFAIMVDDFMVPGDPGYLYDGIRGQPLSAVLIADIVKKHDLLLRYPALPSSQEGGMKRGSVIILPNNSFGRELAALPVLREDPNIG